MAKQMIIFKEPWRVKLRSTLVACGVALLAICAIVYLRPEPPLTPVEVVNKQPAWGTSPFSSGEPPKVTLSLQNAPELKAEVSSDDKAALVDSSIKAGTPSDLYRGFLLIRACELARRLDAVGQPPTPPSSVTCGNVTPGQMTMRAQLLNKAAEAGVPGAFWAFLSEGPDGSSKIPVGTPADRADPASAEYFEKIERFQEAAAKMGDRVALMGVSMRAQNEDHDLPKALTYWVAQQKVAAAQGLEINSAYDTVVARLSSSMTPEQASAAVASGTELANASSATQCIACASPEDAGLPQPAMVERIAAQLARAPKEWVTSQKFQSNDTVTSCVNSDCQSVAYQSTGVWVPVPTRP